MDSNPRGAGATAVILLFAFLLAVIAPHPGPSTGTPANQAGVTTVEPFDNPIGR